MDREIALNFPSVPISYAVELTYKCNNACSGCANVLSSRRNEVLYEWQALFDKIAPPGNRRKYAELLRITGGEPTLHPEFSQIIKYIDTFGIPHATFTNGLWEAPDRVIETFQQREHFIGCLMSLHGSTAAAHSAFVENSPKVFAETCANIQRAVEAGLEVFTNTVLTRYSCEQIEEVIALSQQLGAGYAVFNRYLGKPHPIEPTDAQLREAIELIERLHRAGVACRIGDCVPPCFVKNSSLGSNGGVEHCIISPRGFVRPDNLTGYTFGNLFENSIEEIWQSEQAEWYRQQVPENCLECVELPRCRGGCRSVTIEYGLEGDRLMQEPIRETPVETLEFNPQWKLVPYFTVREESFGYLLCRYDWSVPVSFEAKPLLEAIQQEVTLVQFQEQFGEDALDFIGHLYREGCVDFQ